MDLLLGVAGAVALGGLIASWMARRERERRVSLALQESDALYRTLVDRVPIGVVIHRGGRIVFANGAAAAVAGVAGDGGLVGRNIAEFLVEKADREAVRERFHDLESGGGEVPPAMLVFRAATGSQVVVEARSVRVALEGEATVLTLWNDVTDRMQAEREINESQMRLALAVSASGLALFDWNVQTDEMVLSAEWARIAGGRHAPLHTTGAAMRALLHPEDERATLSQIAALLRGEIPLYDAEHRVRTDDGAWRWIASRAKVTARDAAGRATRVTGTNADISYRKEVERLKDELIASVSHELRTPLTSMLASLALLREGRGGALPEPAAKYLALACENGERLSALVNAILDFERVAAGTMRLHMEPVNLAQFMRRALALNAPLAERYRVRFSLDAPQDLPGVEADPERLLQVVTNLLSNAAKFSAEGGEVRVALRAADGRVGISVADDGCGIDEAFQVEIFKRFARAPGSEGPRKGGTGLGLAISKALVERMGGRISFVSEAGRGATFRVELPAA